MFGDPRPPRRHAFVWTHNNDEEQCQISHTARMLPNIDEGKYYHIQEADAYIDHLKERIAILEKQVDAKDLGPTVTALECRLNTLRDGLDRFAAKGFSSNPRTYMEIPGEASELLDADNRARSKMA